MCPRPDLCERPIERFDWMLLAVLGATLMANALTNWPLGRRPDDHPGLGDLGL